MQALEREILTELLRDMRNAGYQPAAVWDGEEYVMGYDTDGGVRGFVTSEALDRIVRPLTDDEALEAIDSVCESTLHLTHRNADTWGNRGALLILGNGRDIISDYHCAEGEPFGAVIDAIYERLLGDRLVRE